MNIAHMKSKAAAASRVTRIAFVRRAAAVGLLGLAVISSAAAAGPGRDDRGGWQRESAPQRQYEDRRERQYDDRQQRQAEDRQFQRAEEQRRQQQAQNQEGRRGGRLTPDERRDLRRQINEAGADIYQRERRR